MMVCDFLSEVVKESVDPYLQMLTLRGLSDGATNSHADWLGCDYLRYLREVSYLLMTTWCDLACKGSEHSQGRPIMPKS